LKGKTVVWEFEAGLEDNHEYKISKIIDYVREHPESKEIDIRFGCRLSEPHCYRLLREMEKRDLLRKISCKCGHSYLWSR